MPKFRITSPQGEKYDITAPDDATEAQVMDVAQKHFVQAASDRKEMEKLADPTAGMSGLEKAAAGAGKFVSDLGTGAQQIAGKVGIGEGVSNTDVADLRKRDAPLMKSWWAKGGYFAPALAAAFVPGANVAAGGAVTGATLGALQPTGEGESRLANTLVGGVTGAAGGAIGEELSPAITTALARRAAERATAQQANATRDATLAAGREAGYVVPPTQANPTVLNKVLEGTAGKLSTAQAASAKNQAVTNKLTALGLKLPHDEPITAEALQTVRETAGKAYEKIAAGKFVADDTYKQAIEKLAVSHRNLSEQIPELANKDVLALTKSLQKDTFDGRTLIEAMKALREKATIAYRAGETQAGQFYKGASHAIEDLMERNLLYTGAGGKKAVEELRSARQLIAKTHAAEAALNPTTGNIDAKVFANALRRKQPMTGEMRQVAEFATAFPKAVQLPEKMGSQPGISPLDAAVAVLKGGVTGALTLGARPAARSTILSKTFQDLSATPNYSTPLAERVAQRIAQSNRTRAVTGVAGPDAVFTERAALGR